MPPQSTHTQRDFTEDSKPGSGRETAVTTNTKIPTFPFPPTSFHFYFSVALGIELKGSGLLGKHSTTELTLQLCIKFLR